MSKKEETQISRRSFIKKSATLTAGLGLGLVLPGRTPLYAQSTGNSGTAALKDLAAVRNGSPNLMFDKGIEALGGMGRFISKGDVVLLKPNASFNSAPDRGATTHPALVKRVVEHCYNAGASKVYAIDHVITLDSYNGSGIKRAVEEAGGIMVDIQANSGYVKVQIPGAKRLKQTEVHELVVGADKIINLPILKNHNSTGMSCGLKNLMGLVWDRYYYHRNNLDQCIADFGLYRKPDLTVVDAYYVMANGGPRGWADSKILKAKMQIISPDIVSADTAALAQAKQLGVKGLDKRIGFLDRAVELGLGNNDLTSLNIARISI